jgi:hypothetical protein
LGTTPCIAKSSGDLQEKTVEMLGKKHDNLPP